MATRKTTTRSEAELKKAKRGLTAPETKPVRKRQRAGRKTKLTLDVLARFPDENPNPVLRMGMGGLLLYANKASAPLLKQWGCRKGGTLPPEWKKRIDKTLSSLEPILANEPCGKRIFAMDIVPIKDVGYANVYGRDITERKQAEEALNVSEVRYRRLFESAKDGILILDAETGMIVDVNPFLIEILGYSLDQFKGKMIWELGFFKNAVVNRDRFLELQQKEYIRYEDLPLETAYGRCINVEFVGNVYLVDHKKIIQCNIRDITDRKRVEEELTKSEGKFRAIFDNASDGMFLVDLKARKFFMCNTACAKMLGYAQEEFSNLDIADIHPGEDLSFIYEQIEKFSRGEEGIRSDIRFKRKDGSTFATDLSPALLTIAEKKYLLIIFKDITERKQAEEKLKSLLKEKEVLVREVHHRVKNNFTIVSSLLNLQSQQIEDENIQNMFTKSSDRIRSMSLIHERLYQSQDLTHINLSEYIRTLAADLYHAYETDPAKVSLVVEADDVSLNVDQTIPCGLVLNELISNALKYGFPSGWNRKGRIKVTLRKIDEKEIELAVKDNGAGLPDDFDIEKTKSLGLKIINLLVADQLGGKLKVVKNKGTGFIVRFNIEK